VSAKAADWPAVMVPEVGEAEREKSPVLLEPVPVSFTDWGLPEALSAILRVPVRVPEAVGVNVTLIVQFPPAAREVPQLSASAKSPVAEILEIVKGAEPVLVSVTVCAALVAPTL
jgi:hypothetical protein